MKQGLKLRVVIACLVLLSVTIIFSCNIVVFYKMNREHIIAESMQINRVYAEKLADSTEFMFRAMQMNLEVEALEVSKTLHDKHLLKQKLDLLLRSNKYYNSTLAVSKDGKVIAMAPDLGLDGMKLISSGSNQALKEKRFQISSPFIGATGRLIVLVTQPLWDEHGNYAGYVGGTIYLGQDNVLQNILGKHFSEDGSYVYVVDRQGSLIYHPNKMRVGQNIAQNPVIQKVMYGAKGGVMQLTNSQGVEMLAGYSVVEASKWGIISQTPLDTVLAPNLKILMNTIGYTLPFLLLTIFFSLLLSNKIAKPLEMLASFSEKVIENEKEVTFTENFRPWYYEAKQLYKSAQHSVKVLYNRANQFKEDSLTDALTGLQNRRAADLRIRDWTAQGYPFALVLLDIDKFKLINDQYGHQMGDEVLRFLGQKLQENIRQQDYCYRYGGEEFMILLPQTNGQDAFDMIDRIRMLISVSESPTGKAITVSGGIHLSKHSASIQSLISMADQCLYKAKEDGRNRIVIMR